MNSIIQFKLDRFLHLLKLDTLHGHRRTLLIGAVVFAILLTTAITWAADHDNDIFTFHLTMFPNVLLIGGFFFTASIFKELDEQNTALIYLTLPASNFEKFLSKWLVSTLGFLIFTMLGYWLFSIIGNGITSSFFNCEMGIFNPFDDYNWLFVKLYVTLQSIFLIGAALFRKYVAVKTVVSVFIIAIVFAALVWLWIRIVFASDFIGAFEFQGPKGRPSNGFEDFMKGPAYTGLQYLFWLIMPLLFWTVSFFKLKEKEV